MRALVAGHLCLDFMPELPTEPGREPGALYLVGPMHVQLGGSVNTTGAALSALGVTVLLAAAQGSDSLAPVQRDLLARNGLDLSRMVDVDGSTSYSIVLQPPGSDRTFWHHTGCNDLFDGTALDVSGVDLLHIGYPNLLPSLLPDDGEPLRALCERAHAAGVVTSVDLAVVDRREARGADVWEAFLAHTLPAVDVLTPSIDDLDSAVGWGCSADAAGLAAAADRLVALGAGVVMVTGGAAGMAVATTTDAARLERLAPLAHLAPFAGEAHYVPAAPVQRVAGTTGAGDTATAAFLAALLRGESSLAAARFAAEKAALHVSGQPL